MIDSTVFQLKDFKIRNKYFFDGVNKKEVRGRFVVVSKYPKKFYELKKKEQKYFPAITLNESLNIIEIQVSLPKLLYGTNLFEVDETDIKKIFLRLQECLKELYIDVEIEALEKAILKRVDFCKSFQVPYYLGTSTNVLHTLSKYNVKRSSSFREKEYYQDKEGNVLKFWNTTQGFVIYDKISEIFSNGWTEIDLAIKNKFIEEKYFYSIMRMELSLQKKQSLNAFLRSRLKNKKKDFVLSDVMNRELIKKIILEKVDEIFDEVYTMIFSLSEMNENKLERYLLSKKLPLHEHYFISYWIKKTINIGMQTMLNELKLRTSPPTFQRQKKKLVKVSDKIGKIPCIEGNLIDFFKSELNKFDILKPK